MISAPNAVPNPLNSFSSYTYVFTLSALNKNEINFPDETYKRGVPLSNIILRSGGGSPESRITVPGANRKFELYMDGLQFEQAFGGDGRITPAMNLEFTIIEPYSIGIFLHTLQRAAISAAADSGSFGSKPNYLNWTYLITIEFFGYDSSGHPLKVSNLTKHIPIKITETNMIFTGGGSKYQVLAQTDNLEALSDNFNMLPVDIAIAGSTVHEMLQTGKESLQNILNKRLKEYTEALKVPGLIPDQVAIVFPKDSSSGKNLLFLPSTTSTATTSSTSTTTVKRTLGNASGQNISNQSTADMNEIGTASLNIDMGTPGECQMPEDNKAQTDPDKPAFRNKINVSVNAREFRFRQASTIINAITQVVTHSEFCKNTATGTSPPDESGFSKWFRIDVETHLLDSSEENLKRFGREPKLLIFRVIPTKFHSSIMQAPNSVPIGYSKLLNQVVKEYDYVYTGKSIDILSLEFKINNGFYQLALADAGIANKDSHRILEGSAIENAITLPPRFVGNGILDRTVGTYRAELITAMSIASQGGGAGVNYDTNRSRLLHDIYTDDSVDQMHTFMTIIGDPYYIAQSGVGNFNNYTVGLFNQTDDGSINYQTGEVDILIKFTTPYDISEDGLADFGNGTSSSFTGLYRVLKVTSKFNQGKFTQDLELIRRRQQEAALNDNSNDSGGNWIIGDFLETSGFSFESFFSDLFDF